MSKHSITKSGMIVVGYVDAAAIGSPILNEKQIATGVKSGCNHDFANRRIRDPYVRWCLNELIAEDDICHLITNASNGRLYLLVLNYHISPACFLYCG